MKVRGCFKKRAILKRVIARLRNSPNWKKTKRDVTASFRGSRNSPSFLLPSRLLFRKNLSSKAISSSSSPCSFRNRRIVRWPFARDTFRPPYKLTHPISPLNSFNSQIQQSFDELSVYRDSPAHTSTVNFRGKGITRHYFSRDVDESDDTALPSGFLLGGTKCARWRTTGNDKNNRPSRARGRIYARPSSENFDPLPSPFTRY